MTDNISRLRTVELELLEVFSKVCDEHGLVWYIFFGTLLGYVRNNGFLTWDDDIDVVMPEEDYITLCNHGEWFDERYMLQTPLHPGLCRYAKLRKNGTTAYREGLLEVLKDGGHHGIAIDIIPLAQIPGTESYHTPTLLSEERKEAVYLKSWFEPAEEGRFEGIEVKIPAIPRKILTETYKEWAWPNGVMDSRSAYWFFDTEKGYEIYARRYTGMLDDIGDKKIFLFGAADSLRIWLERFGLRKQVICTFDNDPAKWGKRLYDVEVRNPEELPGLLGDNSRVIICSLWYDEIWKQLSAMGIEDYYVFLDEYYDDNIGNKVIRREDKDGGNMNIPRWG
ncbi:MAG: LicD family protein [Lachnospiraceae bacterium]|nr:LicD family protein [Lachnospiraceae bacterium]